MGRDIAIHMDLFGCFWIAGLGYRGELGFVSYCERWVVASKISWTLGMLDQGGGKKEEVSLRSSMANRGQSGYRTEVFLPHYSGLTRQALEADLDGDETALIPNLIAKMLYALTYNRQIK